MQTGVMWRADDDLWDVVEVECPNGLFPHHDADGKRIFDNTHFRTREEALVKLLAEADAFVSLSVDRLRRAEREVADAKEKVVTATLARADALSRFAT